ncbi:hypothetical protein CHH83_23900, partial [Bacillus sp. 7586-K]
MSITATFDKETNILTIEEEGKEKVVLDLGDISKDYVVDETISTSPKVRAAASTTKQNTFINFEYTIMILRQENRHRFLPRFRLVA